MFWYIDPVYFWYVLVPVLVISAGVQIYLKSTFSKWSQVRNSSHLAAGGSPGTHARYAERSLRPRRQRSSPI
jgi:hypothetical protein